MTIIQLEHGIIYNVIVKIKLNTEMSRKFNKELLVF